MRYVVFLFMVLLLAVIFIEGLMIIDQEIRIDKMQGQVDYTTGNVDNMIERANNVLREFEGHYATSSPDVKL